MGRLLLSYKSDRDIRRLMADRPSREVSTVLVNAELDQLKETVVHEGKFESGLCSVAAPDPRYVRYRGCRNQRDQIDAKFRQAN